ncbi:hypothetical protein ACFSTD_21595 [Novosphingobium colocasiae]
MTNSGFGGSHPGQGGQQDGQNGFGQNDFGQNGYGQSLPDQSGNWQSQEFSAPDPSFAGDPAPLNPDNGGNWQDPNAPAPWQDEPQGVSAEPWQPQEEEEPFFSSRRLPPPCRLPMTPTPASRNPRNWRWVRMTVGCPGWKATTPTTNRPPA